MVRKKENFQQIRVSINILEYLMVEEAIFGCLRTFSGTPVAEYYEDGKKLNKLSEDFYSSKDYTIKMLDYINTNDNSKNPFFAYLAYTAPHWPLHVPDEWIDKYKGIYDEGWDEIRESRFNRQKSLGILPEDSELPPMNRVVKKWSEISTHQKKIELKRIELHAYND